MPHQKYKLVAIDLDETLLGPDHCISERNAIAVKAVAKLGVTVIIASGRMYEATVRYATQLALSGPTISYNGALVKLAETGDEWLHERVPSAAAQEVMEYCHENGLQLNFYHNGQVHSTADTEWLQLYCSRTGSPYVIEPDMMERLRGVSPTKLLIVDTEVRTNGLLPTFKDRYQGVLYVTKTTNEYLEMMPLNANKGAALAYVANRLGVTFSETVAIGDSYNDIPMVEWAGLGAAVGNAKPELQLVAEQIIGRSEDDGVAAFLEEIFSV